MRNYIFSEKGSNFLKDYEVLKLKAYRPTPTDKWTIAWGNTTYENGSAVKQGDVISLARAIELWNNTIKKFIGWVNYLVNVDLSQNQFDALVILCYNIGPDIDADTIPEGLGDSRLLKLINAGSKDLAEIEKEWLSWRKAGGIVLHGLEHRRASEFNIFKNNQYIRV